MRSDEESVPLVDQDLQEEKLTGYAHHGLAARRLSDVGRALQHYIGPDRWAFCTNICTGITDRSLPILDRIRRRASNAGSTGISRTEWLNGVRGVAALIVFWYHFQFTWHGEFTSRYGYGGGPPGTEEENRWFMQLPFIRLLVSGDVMVSVFFVVSGFSLSIKPISLIRQGEHTKLLTSLSSSVWRRAGRLYLPCLCITFLFGVLGTQLGLYEFAKAVGGDREAVAGRVDDMPDQLPSLWLQFQDWCAAMKWWSSPFSLNHTWGLKYAPPLWTIPFEFRCSIMLFVIMLGLARIRTAFRLLASITLIWYCAFHIDQWEMVLFLSGFVLAELDAVRLARREILDSVGAPRLPRRSLIASRIIWYTSLIISLYLMSTPPLDGATSPGYRTIFAWNDYILPEGFRFRERYPQFLGSILFIWSLTHLSPVRRLFSTAPARYLGRISFMLYVIQHPMHSSLAYRLVLGVRYVFAGSWHVGFAQKEVTFIIAAIIHTALCIGVAEIMTRLVDNRCLQLIRWVERKAMYSTDRQGAASQSPTSH